MYIKAFSSIKNSDKDLVGGKAFSLGKLVSNRINVPKGFVITTELSKESELTQATIDSILKQFDRLYSERVAVRSSAVSEDSSKSSWAGQLDTYLNVVRDDLVIRIKDCWQSIDSNRVEAYAKNKSSNEANLAMAVIVQSMVDSLSSGVAFTVNPTTYNMNEIVIEAGWGLGESVVQGEITPESIAISKKDFNILARTSLLQDKMLIFKDGKNIKVPIAKKLKVLSDKQAIELAKLIINIEEIYGVPMDIEWALQDRKFYILQARPITTLK